MENQTTAFPTEDLLTYEADGQALQGLITRETRNQIQSLLGVTVLPVVFLCGTVGNLLAIVVLCHEGLRENVNVVLLCLAVSDLGYVVSYYIPLLSEMVKFFDVVTSIRIKVLTAVRLETTALIFGRISAIFVCFIAVQRFISIAVPLKASTILTKFRVRLTCVLIYLVIFGMYIPNYLILDYEFAFSSVYNESIPVAVNTKFYLANTKVLQKYFLLYLTILLRIAPVFLVLVLSLLIVVMIKRNRKWSQAVSNASESRSISKERKITKTLLSVCILFLATGIPYVVYYLMMTMIPEFDTTGRYRNSLFVTYTSVSILEMINASANFVLYVSTSSRFYATFRRVFCTRLRCREAFRES